MNKIIQAVTFTTWTRLVCSKSNLHEITLNIGENVTNVQNSLQMYSSTTSKRVQISENKEIIIYGLYILKRSNFEDVTFHLDLISFPPVLDCFYSVEVCLFQQMT